MGFTVAATRNDHTQEDAVRGGVADGLARMLGVPKHPDSVQAILDRDTRAEKDRGKVPARPKSVPTAMAR